MVLLLVLSTEYGIRWIHIYIYMYIDWLGFRV